MSITERAGRRMVGQRIRDACQDFLRNEDRLRGQPPTKKPRNQAELEAKRWAIVRRLRDAAQDALELSGIDAP